MEKLCQPHLDPAEHAAEAGVGGPRLGPGPRLLLKKRKILRQKTTSTIILNPCSAMLKKLLCLTITNLVFLQRA